MPGGVERAGRGGEEGAAVVPGVLALDCAVATPVLELPHAASANNIATGHECAQRDAARRLKRLSSASITRTKLSRPRPRVA